MNYLLYGADTYRSRKKLREMIAGYAPRVHTGAVDVLRFDAGEDDLQALYAAAHAGSLFGAKKLIVLERPFTAGEQFDITRRALADTHQTEGTLVFVWDDLLDAEGKQRLEEMEKYFDKIQKFAPLTGAHLQRWIREEAVTRGAVLSAEIAADLAILYGADLRGISQQLEKIAIGGADGKISAARQPTVFDLGDSFFSSPVVARRILLSLIRAGEEEMRLFAYLTGHARALLVIKAYADRGMRVPASSRINPYVIQKASRQVRMLSVNGLVHTLSRFFEEDRKIKTGTTTARESLFRMLS